MKKLALLTALLLVFTAGCNFQPGGNTPAENPAEETYPTTAAPVVSPDETVTITADSPDSLPERIKSDMPEPFPNYAGDSNLYFYATTTLKLGYIDMSFAEFVDSNEEFEKWFYSHSSYYGDFTAIDEAGNLYSFIKYFDFPEEKAREILVNLRNGTEDDFSDEEIDLILSGTPEEVAEHFAHENAICKGKNLYSLNWIYLNSIDEYKKNGLSPEEIKSRIPLFNEYYLNPSAETALEKKLSEYIGEPVDIVYAHEYPVTTTIIDEPLSPDETAIITTAPRVEQHMPEGTETVKVPVDIILPDETEAPMPEPEPTDAQAARNAVRERLSEMKNEDYTLYMNVWSVEPDSAESGRVAGLWTESELAESKGLSEIDLYRNLIAVKALYYTEYDHEKTFLDDGLTTQYFYVVKKNGKWEIADNSSPNIFDIDALRAGVKLSTDKNTYREGEDISTTLSNASEIGFSHSHYFPPDVMFERFEGGEWVEVPRIMLSGDLTIPDVACEDCPVHESGESGAPVSKINGDCNHTFKSDFLKAYYEPLTAGRYRIKIDGFFAGYKYRQEFYSNEFEISRTAADEAIRKYNLLLNRYTEDLANCDFCGGAYYEGGKLYILTTDLAKAEVFTDITGTENVEIVKCNFPLAYLMKLDDRIMELFDVEQYEINSIGVSEKNNVVGVTVSSEAGAKALAERLKADGFDERAVSIAVEDRVHMPA